MSYIKNIKDTILRARREYGLVGAVKRYFLQNTPVYFSCVYATGKLLNSCRLHELNIIRYQDSKKLNPEILDNIGRQRGQRTADTIKKLFSQGSDLWIGWLGNKPAGICWTTCVKNRCDYFVPLTTQDKVIYACFVFPEYRGRGVYPFMLQTIVNELLQKEQIKQVYIDCKSWNMASRKGIEKAGFHFIGRAVRVELFNHVWIPWNQCRLTHKIS